MNSFFKKNSKSNREGGAVAPNRNKNTIDEIQKGVIDSIDAQRKIRIAAEINK